MQRIFHRSRDRGCRSKESLIPLWVGGLYVCLEIANSFIFYYTRLHVYTSTRLHVCYLSLHVARARHNRTLRSFISPSSRLSRQFRNSTSWRSIRRARVHGHFNRVHSYRRLHKRPYQPTSCISHRRQQHQATTHPTYRFVNKEENKPLSPTTKTDSRFTGISRGKTSAIASLRSPRTYPRMRVSFTRQASGTSRHDLAVCQSRDFGSISRPEIVLERIPLSTKRKERKGREAHSFPWTTDVSHKILSRRDAQARRERIVYVYASCVCVCMLQRCLGSGWT